jgi:hypothetical protein
VKPLRLARRGRGPITALDPCRLAALDGVLYSPLGIDSTGLPMQQDGLSGTRCALIVLILVAAPGAAMAYIDPGSGAYMVQALFALVAAGLFYLRHPIRSLQSFWRWISGQRSPAETQTESVDSDSLAGSEDSR